MMILNLQAAQSSTKLMYFYVVLQIQVRRDAFEFRRDVIVGAEDPLTGSTVGEALLRWLEDRVSKRERQEEKLKAKVHELKHGAVRSGSGTARAGTCSGELQYIDLHQLEIENEQFASKVEDAKADIAAKKRRCCKFLVSRAFPRTCLRLPANRVATCWMLDSAGRRLSGYRNI